MSGTIQKWGNSLAIRIPKGLASELKIEPGTPVRISREKNRIVITPATPVYTLEELVKGITPQNRHGEINTGAPRGKEFR
jgi:antitoxin MazE